MQHLVTVNMIVKVNRRVLMLRRGGEGAFSGLWTLPGGKVEPGENWHEAGARECVEETGVVVSKSLLVGSYGQIIGERAWSGVILLATRFDATAFMNVEPNKHGDLQWIEQSNKLFSQSTRIMPTLFNFVAKHRNIWMADQKLIREMSRIGIS